MAMSYTSLIAPKGTTGSILNWVGYTKIDLATVVDEAQYLLYETLRVREMRKEWTFGVAVGQASQALPSRFLDPIGKIYDVTNNTEYDHGIETAIVKKRVYDSSIAGTFGTDPFTTTLDSSRVSVSKTAHGFNQDSTVTIPNAPVVNGITLTGSFPVVTITDANNYIIDTGDTLATASGAGGGAGVTYTGNNLVAGSARWWAVWDETVKFDVAFDTQAVCKLLYYRQPELLSAANPTNFLTNRYPKLMRVACLAAAAEYMKDDEEMQKALANLSALIQNTAAVDDLMYRGATFGTDTP
jgi:hypothetical protein